jgi:hypothetical protein
MGMFDSFFAPITCPRCKQHFPNGELQTKHGVCHLEKVRIGESSRKIDSGLQTGVIDDILWFCPNDACRKATAWKDTPRVKVFIRDFVFMGAKVEDQTNPDDDFADSPVPFRVEVAPKDNYVEQLEQVIARVKDAFENGDYSKVYDELKDYGHLSVKE